MTHTKGPWTLAFTDRDDCLHGIYAEAENSYIALVLTGPNADEDAALIKAAPDLLAALKVIANSEEYHGDSFVCDFATLQGVARAAVAAITK